MFSSNSSSVQPRPRRRRRCGHEEKDNCKIYNQRNVHSNGKGSLYILAERRVSVIDAQTSQNDLIG